MWKKDSSFGKQMCGIVGRRFCIKDCIKPSRKRNMCTKHYQRLKRLGTTSLVRISGDKHWAWKKDGLKYGGIHARIKKMLVKPEKCSSCGKSKKWLDLANISQKYSLFISDWEWLCRSCHMIKDGRMLNLRNQVIT